MTIHNTVSPSKSDTHAGLGAYLVAQPVNPFASAICTKCDESELAFLDSGTYGELATVATALFHILAAPRKVPSS